MMIERLERLHKYYVLWMKWLEEMYRYTGVEVLVFPAMKERKSEKQKFVDGGLHIPIIGGFIKALGGTNTGNITH